MNKTCEADGFNTQTDFPHSGRPIRNFVDKTPTHYYVEDDNSPYPVNTHKYVRLSSQRPMVEKGG